MYSGYDPYGSGYGSNLNSFGGGLERMLSSLLPLIVAAIVAYLIWNFLKKLRKGARGQELQPAGDAMRYALASAVLKGSIFRQRVLRMARNKYRAIAPELGLDFPLLVRACRYFEVGDRALCWAIAGAILSLFFVPVLIQILGIYSLLRFWSMLSPLIGLGAIGLAVYKMWRERFALVNIFRRERFDLNAVRSSIPESHVDDHISAAADANVICYGVVDPFVGLGKHYGGWQISVDVSRAPEGKPGPAAIDIDDVYEALAQNVLDLKIENLTIRDAVFVNGSESDQIPELQADRLSRPRTHVDAETVSRFRRASDARARAYRWITIKEWGGELVFSYLFRCVRRGEALCVETVQLVLPPVKAEYREIDAVRFLSFWGLLRWIVVSVVKIPFVMLGAFVSISAQIRDAILNLFGGEDAAERKEIRANPAYNYGARESIRESMASDQYHVYFQRVDGVQYFNAIDQQVINALADLLEARGVDATSLRQRAQLIVNNGTMVGSGATFIGAAAGAGGAATANSTLPAGLAGLAGNKAV